MYQTNKTLLQLLTNREQWQKLRLSIDFSRFDKEVRLVLKHIQKYWNNTDATSMNMEVLISDFFIHNSLSDPERAYYNKIFDIMNHEPDQDTAKDIIRNLRTMEFHKEIEDANKCYSEGDDIDLYETVRGHVNVFESDIRREADTGYCVASMEEIIADEQQGSVLEWPIDNLRRAMPGLRTGMQVIVAARPGKGKTSFLAHANMHFLQGEFLRTTFRPIVWFNNEGKKIRIKGSHVRAGLRKDFDEISKLGWGEAEERFNSILIQDDQLRIYDIHGKDYMYLERIIENDNPAVVVFDMLDNVKGFYGSRGQDRKDQQLEALYQWARECAVKYDFLSIPTSQISVEGAEMQWVPESCLKDSKCLGYNTGVRMYNGGTKYVQDIKIGDTVMGMDSAPRDVLCTGTGTEKMYQITGKGWSFSSNKSHILTCIKSTKKPMNNHKQGDIVDLPLQYFLDNPSRLVHYKAIKAQIEYSNKDYSSLLDPYVFGLWLGDGSSKEVKITVTDEIIKEFLEKHANYQHTYKQRTKPENKVLHDVYHTGGRALLRAIGVYQNKHIPDVYKLGDIKQREQLLAGLIDSDGYIDHGGSVICMHNERLIMDIKEVADSLGYRTSVRHKITNFNTDAWIVSIRNTTELPVLLDRKRTLCKQVYDTMRITELGEATYYGFTVNKDSRYVLDNYIVTHNTGKQGACDAIITIGSVSTEGFDKSRFIYVPKSKFKPAIGYPADCRTEVVFDAARSLYLNPKLEDPF